uniref:Uncharacterized protein n=1 Tax=Populus alba TaxID=43335 RepID=A0A4U5PZL0_POPAL|nr:hypothetical protein D5086_0000160420 [Populus alba]
MKRNLSSLTVHAVPKVATSETASRASGVTPKADLSTVAAAGVMDSDSRRFVRISGSVPARYLTAKPVEVYLISVPVGVPLPSISGSLAFKGTGRQFHSCGTEEKEKADANSTTDRKADYSTNNYGKEVPLGAIPRRCLLSPYSGNEATYSTGTNRKARPVSDDTGE